MAHPTSYDAGGLPPPTPTLYRVSRPFIGVRWWLGIAFAVVAATSTAIVVSYFSNRSEDAFRRHGEQVALKDARWRRSGAARRASASD